jgi:hypothetical protein
MMLFVDTMLINNPYIIYVLAVHSHDRNQTSDPILSEFRAYHTFTVLLSQINFTLNLTWKAHLRIDFFP